jgi:transcriptional regulator with XRE-family HTH domain
MDPLLRNYERKIAFGRWIRARRKEYRLSQEALAKRMGWPHKSNVSNIETGKINFPLNRLYDLADAFALV